MKVPGPWVMAVMMALSALTLVVRRVEDGFDGRNAVWIYVFPFDGVSVTHQVVVVEVNLTVDNF